VYSQLLLVTLNALPMPPVARTTAFAAKSLNRPRPGACSPRARASRN